VIRTDIDCSGCGYSEEKLSQVSALVFRNSTFHLYELNNYRTVVAGNRIKAGKVSPAQYELQFKGVMANSEISFLQSFNENWRLYLVPKDDGTCELPEECSSGRAIFKLSDLNLFLARQLGVDSHRSKFGYENTWMLSKSEVELHAKAGEITKNSDGSIDFSAVLIYYPQLSYILSGLVSLFAFLVLIVAIVFRSRSTGEETQHV
jgi:hypothetical protein